MATINTTGIFPATKFLSTDANGDLQEVVSSPQTTGSLSFDGLTFTATTAGLLTPAPSVELVEDATATGVEVSVSGSDITIKVQSTNSVPAVPATKDQLILDGITYDAEVAGDSGLKLTILEAQASDGIAYDSATKVITISLDNSVGNKTQGDIANIYALAGSSIKDLIDVTITNNATALSVASADNAFSGGTDETPEVPATGVANFTQTQIKSAYDSEASAVAIATLAVENGSANLTATKAQTSFNGAEAVTGDLEASTDYILLSRTDLHDLLDGEKDDGRKFLWGIIHKASEVLGGLGDPPSNFTISKGNPTSVDNGTALRQNYSISAKYAVDNLDLKAEA